MQAQTRTSRGASSQAAVTVRRTASTPPSTLLFWRGATSEESEKLAHIVISVFRPSPDVQASCQGLAALATAHADTGDPRQVPLSVSCRLRSIIGFF